MTIFLAVLAAVFILILIMTVRTIILPTAVQKNTSPTEDIPIDAECAITHLKGAVAIPTVSRKDRRLIDYAKFLEFHRYLEISFPNIHRVMTRETVDEYNLLFHWKGSSPGKEGALFISHMDTVPEGDPDQWTFPPFSGADDGDYIYGRGTLDMKGHMICMLEAFEALIQSGFAPDRDVYIALGHDEELMDDSNSGAKKIAQLLEGRGVKCSFSLDEGGLAYTGEYLGLDHMIGLIGICERGYADIKITAYEQGGHASMPPKKTAMGKICSFGSRLEAHPMKCWWNEPASLFIKYVAPYAKGFKKFIFANKWFFSPFILHEFSKYQRAHAMVSSTCAVTMAEGSTAANVLPREASLTVNMRLAPGDTMDKITAYLSAHKDSDMDMEVLSAIPPSAVASTTCEAYSNIADAIRETFPEIVPLPYPVIFGTDSRHFYNVARDVYHYTPFLSFYDDIAALHSVNERVRKDSFLTGIQFFSRVIQKSCK